MKNISLICIMLFMTVSISSIHSMTDPKWSPDGRYIAFSDFYRQRVVLYDTIVGTSLALEGTATGGRLAQWSSDGSKLAFKVVQKQEDNQTRQAPAIWFSSKNEIRLLADVSSLSGNPVFSANEQIAFTTGTQLRILNQDQDETHRAELPSYANWIALHPHKPLAVYNDDNDALWLTDYHSGKHQRITPEDQGYCRPMWSPDGNYLLISSLSGTLF
ncbi:PD40 domain-containing protein, partial [bacterium]|nr:PD40 domain-containing protein [candidate division CSSED10-310 bacterium]